MHILNAAVWMVRRYARVWLAIDTNQNFLNQWNGDKYACGNKKQIWHWSAFEQFSSVFSFNLKCNRWVLFLSVWLWCKCVCVSANFWLIDWLQSTYTILHTIWSIYREKQKKNETKQNNKTKKSTGMQLKLSTWLIYAIRNCIPFIPREIRNVIMISVFQTKQSKTKKTNYQHKIVRNQC